MNSNRTGVFISYRRTDRGAADRLYALLTGRGIDTWYDSLIRHDADWRDEIVKHLGKAKVMVILLSAAALESDELKKELAVASQEKVPVLVARLEDVKPTAAFAYELARVTWFDLFHDPAGRFEQLTDLIERLVQEDAKELETLIPQIQPPERKVIATIKNFPRKNSLLLYLFGGVSVVQFGCYEMMASPVEELVRSGVGQLVAFFYVLVAVTIGSPLLLFSVLKGGVSVRELPLLATAALNSGLLIWLICNLFFSVYHRLLFYTRKA